MIADNRLFPYCGSPASLARKGFACRPGCHARTKTRQAPALAPQSADGPASCLSAPPCSSCRPRRCRAAGPGQHLVELCTAEGISWIALPDTGQFRRRIRPRRTATPPVPIHSAPAPCASPPEPGGGVISRVPRDVESTNLKNGAASCRTKRPAPALSQRDENRISLFREEYSLFASGISCSSITEKTGSTHCYQMIILP